jgi:structural maintenance of chromosome 2
LEFQKKSSELERLNKLVVASDWMQLESRKSRGIETIKLTELDLKASITGQARMESEIARMEMDGKDITKRRDEELAKGGKVQKLEQEQKDLARGLALLRAKVDIGQSTIADEVTRSNELELNAKEVGYDFHSIIASACSLTTFLAVN